MKPTKNQIFCPECQHPKMLFQTKSEAIRFLRYNADEIEQETGKRPVRAYYCHACGGFHVTSRPQSLTRRALIFHHGEERGSEIYDQLRDYIEKKHGLQESMSRRVKQLRHALKFPAIDIEKCGHMIAELVRCFETVIENKLAERQFVNRLLSKFNDLCIIYINKTQTATL